MKEKPPAVGVSEILEALDGLGSWRLDLESGKTHWSPGLFQLFGLDPGQSPPSWPDGHRAIFGPEEISQLEGLIRNCIEKGQNYRCVLPATRFDNGRRVWIEVHGTLQRDSKGKPCCLYGVCVDRTKEFEIFCEQQAQKSFLDAIIEQTLQGVWERHFGSKPDYLSSSLLQVLKAESRDALPESIEWSDIITPGELPQVEELWQKHLLSRGAVPFRIETQLKRRKQAPLWILLTGKTLEWDPAGRPVRAVGCQIDISRFKAADAQRLAAEYRLGLAVADERSRLAMLMHDSVGQLLATIGLTANRCAYHPGLSQEFAEAARTISSLTAETHRRVRAITKGLCPVDCSRQNFLPGLKKLTASCAQGLSIQCELKAPKNITLPDDHAALNLTLIAQEAILNAARSGRAKRVQVSLVSKRSGVLLRISDNGCGFNPGDNPSPTSGIGLRTMESRARDCGGTFSIQSSPRGTLIEVRIPPAKPATPDNRSIAKSSNATELDRGNSRVKKQPRRPGVTVAGKRNGSRPNGVKPGRA